jgi:hypothetical protein
MMIRMSCRDLDSEDMYVQMRRDLIADTDTVADQIKEREDLEKKKRLLDSQHLLRLFLSFLEGQKVAFPDD